MVMFLFMASFRSHSPYAVEHVGTPGSANYAVWVTDAASGKRISAWHDVWLIPSVATASSHVVNFVNEIPRATRAKYETQTTVAGNPIVQDRNDGGELRSYTYGETFFNYGGIPQTWEDPNVMDVESGAGGDGDPLDVIELGASPLRVGAVTPIKVLGALPMLDQDEIDWKVIAVAVDDPAASRWHSINDVEPRLMAGITDWLVNYKTTDGKPKNVLGAPISSAEAMALIHDCHAQWRALRRGHAPPGKLWTGVPSSAARVPYATILAAAVHAAESAGDVIAAVHTSKALATVTKGTTDEGVVDPLTLADLASHTIITSTLADLWPALVVVSEEDDPDPDAAAAVADLLAAATPRPLDLHLFDDHDPGFLHAAPLDRLTVWVDPLDATKEFTEDLLEYVTVMVTVADAGRPVAACIHQVFADSAAPDQPHVTSAASRASRTVWALSGAATPGGHAESVLSPQPRVIVSRSHPGQLTEPLDALHASKIAAGGSGFKALAVWDGHADIYLHRTAIKLWDIAAPDALFTLNDGTFIGWSGARFDYSEPDAYLTHNGVLASFAPTKRLLAALDGIEPGSAKSHPKS
ncbi:myo inositol monophosphatase, partial [Thecamonas trahens ATCC 50062]